MTHGPASSAVILNGHIEDLSLTSKLLGLSVFKTNQCTAVTDAPLLNNESATLLELLFIQLMRSWLVGPIVYKTAAAALHLFDTSASDSSITQRYVNVTLTNSSGTLLAAVSNNSIILAFNVRLPTAPTSRCDPRSTLRRTQHIFSPNRRQWHTYG